MKKKVFFEEFDSIYYFDGISRNWKMEGLHVHNQYEIILFMSDDVGLEIGNRIYKVGKGDIFFIPSGQIHAICAGCLVAEVQESSNRWKRGD